jgi:DUF1680 family protein
VLRSTGIHFDPSAWDKTLYSAQTHLAKPVALTAIPYCLWDNRSPGEMRVWLPILS